MCALHPTYGGVLFNGLREFEQSQMDDAEDAGDEQAVERTRNSIEKTFTRQLSLPLVRSVIC